MTGSLRLRLLLAAMGTILSALFVAWIAMSWLFERHSERRIAEDLALTGVRIAAGLNLDHGLPFLEATPGDERFKAAASGLYWQVQGRGGALHSPSLWDQELPPAPAAGGEGWTRDRIKGPFEGEVLRVARRVTPPRSSAAMVIEVGESTAGLRASTREFGVELAIFLAVLWAALSAAAWAQVSIGLRPLNRLRDEVQALRRDAAVRLSNDGPSEVAPLVAEINELADAREAELQRARRRAGDLAHSLKTPLAAMAAQSRRAREAGATEAADGLDRAITTARHAVEGELARARLAATAQGEARARPVIEALVDLLEHTEAGARTIIDVEASAEVTAPMTADDLTELLGPLLENAVRHARRRVRVLAQDRPRASISVEDDGDGLGARRADEVLTRGVRLDEGSDGHGLGLAIAKELAEATGARLELGPSDLGGLRATVAWPQR
jgi:signal transduction histidine kinase